MLILWYCTHLVPISYEINYTHIVLIGHTIKYNRISTIDTSRYGSSSIHFYSYLAKLYGLVNENKLYLSFFSGENCIFDKRYVANAVLQSIIQNTCTQKFIRNLCFGID